MLELREKNGPGAVAELIKEPIQNSTHEIIIIDGIRSIHEINVLKETGSVKLLAVHASSDTRFNFLSERKMKVKFNGAVAGPFNLVAGGPQGSRLGQEPYTAASHDSFLLIHW